jgi:GT2 family glycosyltransferase
VDVAVVIPTYERREALLATLGSLEQIDYPAGRWEAIVVDDGSGPATVAAVRDWIHASGMPVRLLQQERRGPASARNAGARLASARVLIFIDNDIIVGPNFLRRHLEILAGHPGCWVIGRIVHPPELRQTPFGRYRDDRWEAFHARHRTGDVVETDGMTAANLALPTEDFRSLGGFDETFSIASCEDWDLGQRARARRVRVLYDPTNVAVHNDWAIGLDQFCRRQMLYSISDVLLWRKYGAESPRARLVTENGPLRWGNDSVKLLVKKMVKWLLARRAGRGAVRLICALSEVVAPDSPFNVRSYDLAVGISIFRGVREGLARCGGSLKASKFRLAREDRTAKPENQD